MSPNLPTTRWSLVRAAAGDCSVCDVRRSLGELCELYRPALVAYLRRRGDSLGDAEDRVQGFLVKLIETNSLDSVDASRGRFRSFLFASLDHHVSNELRKAATVKRGGDQTHVSFDPDAIVGKLDEDPARIFDQQWAQFVVDHTLEELGKEYAAEGRGRWFEILRPAISAPRDAAQRKAIAEELQSTPTAIRVAIHRIRRKYRERLLTVIGETVDDPKLIEQERVWLKLRCEDPDS